jgi:hypothetical protein
MSCFPLRRLLFLAIILATACATAPPDFSIVGPATPYSQASVVITEAAVRHALGQVSPPTPPDRIIVCLHTDLDDAGRAALLSKLSDLPVEFRPIDEVQDIHAGDTVWKMNVSTSWSGADRADVRVYYELAFATRMYVLRGRHESNEWRFKVVVPGNTQSK